MEQILAFIRAASPWVTIGMYMPKSQEDADK